MEFLGYVITEEGIMTTDDKVKAVREWPKSKTVKELRSFIGFVSYYNKFIKNFSEVTKPLQEIMKIGAKKHGKLITKRTSKNVTVEWTIESNEAFEKLKKLLCTAPILSFPHFDKPFRLEIDASDKGMGAVLSQDIDNVNRVVAYARKVTNASVYSDPEYSSNRIEFKALIWAICDKFRHYLIGNKCKVVTDNNALSHIMETRKLSAYEQRGVAKLADFELVFEYRSGKANANADALSRLRCDAKVNIKVLSSMVDTLPILTKEEVISEQKKDKELNMIMNKLEEGDSLKRKNVVLVDGILMSSLWNKDETNKIIVPKSLIIRVLEGVHEGQGHQGIERCTWRVNLAFNWIGKYRDIRNHVNSCSTCNKSKTRGDGKVKLGKLIVSKLLDVLSIDFVSVDKASDGRESILVMTDVFTKFTKAVPTRNQLASTVVKVLLNE